LGATREEKSLDDLESFTVKELKQILIDNELDQERGILTKLKRKQDLVDYLRLHLDNENDDFDDGEDDVNEEDDDDDESVAPPVGIELAEGDFTILDDDEEEETVIGTPPRAIETAVPETKSSALPQMQLSPKIADMIPVVVQEKMASRGITSLLPIQEASFEGIYNGKDAILQSPTGSGKTLAFVLPLLSANKQKPWQRKKVASPRILTICPSRELAKQVGKEYEKIAGKAFGVATVFGGVPLERHVSLLKYKPQIVVTTPGRLRELVREGHMDYTQVSTLVLDEADLLLDKNDSPDVFSAIEDIERAFEESDDPDPEYQMVLVSATIGKNVKEFAREMEFPKSAFVKVDGNLDSKTLVSTKSSTIEASQSASVSSTVTKVTTVGHWHMSCKSSVRPEITSNLISILSPRLTIIFVPTKAATESVASFLSEKASGATIRILHGDMSQTARSRCISMLRETAARKEAIGDSQILVATDVASRGLDLPNVDLVVQFGLPRIAGKEGTINPELYAHRTGRTGRFKANLQGSNDWNTASNRYQTSNAVALYDPAEGEARLVQSLVEEVKEDLGVTIQPMAIPSSAKVVDAAYTRLSGNLFDEVASSKSSNLAEYFRDRLESDDRIDTSNPQELLDRLSEVMVALSKLDPSTSPLTPTSSLLNGDPNSSTLRLYPKGSNKEDHLKPPIVTSFCKARGSGKLGRVVVCGDGSAVFDLPKKKAKRLLEAVRLEEETIDLEFGLEIPSSLPEI